MTAVPPPVPPEIVEKAAKALAVRYWEGRATADDREYAQTAIAAVYGDIVEAARRERAAEIERLRERSVGLRAAELAYDEARAENVRLRADLAERDGLADEVERLKMLLGVRARSWQELAAEITQLRADRDRAVRDARRDALDQARQQIKAEQAATWKASVDDLWSQGYDSGYLFH